MLFDQLTKRQKQVFDFIRDKIDNRGYGPTVREIGEHFEIASAIQIHDQQVLYLTQTPEPPADE